MQPSLSSTKISKEIINQLLANGFEIDTIVSVKPGPIANVYDVKLSKDADLRLPHSLITNNIVTHNSIEPKYTSKILQVKSLNDVFGKKVNGEWVIPRRARYYDDEIIESTYTRIARTLNRIPDKIYRPEDAKWYLVVDPSNPDTAKFNTKTLGDYNTKISTKQKLWFPTDNTYPQAFIGIDSYPVLNTEAMDEKEESSKAMAIQARAYSENLKRIVGKLRRKYVIIPGTNQIREKPGVMFGPTQYEPCGNALKYNSQNRLWTTPRATPPEWRHDSKESKFSEEPSVEGSGTDQYAYKHISNKKNKWGTPFLETWVRIWISDHKGNGRGIDPVFDTLTFLTEVGLAKRVQRKSVAFAKHDWPLSNKTIDWLDFKILVLAEYVGSTELKERAGKVYKRLKLDKPFYLRKFAKHMLKDNGAASLAMQNNKTAQKSAKAAKANSFDDDLEG